MQDTSTTNDPLLGSLRFFLELENKQFSTTSLLAGLPLVNGRLTPELFIRAAARAELSSVVLQKKLEEISPYVLPAILLLDGEKACILKELDRGTGFARLIDLEIGGESSVHLSNLEADYTGFAIYVKPEHKFDRRVQDLGKEGGGHWFWGVIAKSWRIYRDVLLASLMINMFSVAMPLFVMNVYDRVVPNRAMETLWVLAVGILLVFVFDFALKFLRNYFIEIAGKKSDILLSASMFQKMLGLRLSEKAASVGSVSNLFKEFDSLRNFVTSATMVALVDLPFVLLFLLIIWMIGGVIVIVPVVFMVLMLLAGFMLSKPLKKSIDKSLRYSTEKNSILIESLSSIDAIKSLAVEGKIQFAWEQSSSKLAFWSQKSRLISSLVVNLTSSLAQIASVVVVIVGVYLISDGSMSMGALIASMMLTGRAIAPLNQVVSLQINYYQSRTALESLNGYMQKEDEKDGGREYLHHPALAGGIRFKEVSFTYEGHERSALDNISFNIKPGERVAIIGRVGSGKSTILKLILGLYQADQGSVFLDDVDISQLELSDARKNIGYVPQEIVLFHGSIRKNILFGKQGVTDDQLVKAVQQSGVGEFIQYFSRGLDQEVGERGEFLSGGQKQNIAVARAVIGSPPVILLDEPTSQMDNTTENLVKESLESISRDKTLILVTHKTSMLTLADRLIVLDHGKIMADGPKDSVLEALAKGAVKIRKPG
jgi:ATP-binding cassette subfamily C protein LapB